MFARLSADSAALMADLLSVSRDEPGYVTTLKETFNLGRLFEYSDDILEGERIDLDTFLSSISFGRGAKCVFSPNKASKERKKMLTEPDYLYPTLCILLYGYFVQNQIWSFNI